ncbi:MAG: PglZ domain-containing protein, partial [Acidimicrobiales bacterium]
MSSARTMTEAEEILEQGGGGPVLLTKHLGTSDPIEMTIRIACGAADQPLAIPEVRSEAVRFLDQQLGGDFGAVENLPNLVCLRLVAAELSAAGIALAPFSISEFTPEQHRRVSAVARRWQDDRNRLADLRGRMNDAAGTLRIMDDVQWTPQLAEADIAPAFDDVAMHEFLRKYDEGDFAAAAALAKVRRSRFWATWDLDSSWQGLWAVAFAAARVQELTSSMEVEAASPESLFAQYGASTWQVDAEHRRLELGLTRLDKLGDLEAPVQAARHAYEAWLDRYLRVFTSAVSAQGLSGGQLLRQSEVHDKRVDPAIRTGAKVAYFFVDALRYELGRELASSLQRAFGEDAVRVEGAVGAAPSITPVGMASLCPLAQSALRLDLDERDRLMVTIDDAPVMSPPERLALLQAAHGKVVDIVLDDLVTQGEAHLEDRIGDAKVIMVRSQEIDEAGEAGKLAIAHTSFPTIIEHLRRAVAKLSLVGVTRFIISSDHGFLILSRRVGQERIIPKPGGKGELHRRAFIGTGGAAGDELVRIPLSETGIPGELDLLVPRGLALISAGGTRGFFHGGISPQEMLVPVLTIEIESEQTEEPLTVAASITGKIMAAVFTSNIALSSGLFAVDPVDVSVSAVRLSDGAEVAKLVAAGGAEMAEGVVRLSPDTEALLSFQVTTSLGKGDKVAL